MRSRADSFLSASSACSSPPDITLARKLLGWEPKVSRAEGLKITYEYFRSLSPDELYEKEHNTFEGYIRK